jgi:hypothetical protein
MQTNNNLLNVLTREGVLISVNIRYWRAHKKLQAQDIGLDPDDVTDRLISLGHKRLMPKDALAAFALIESRAHALVESATFPFLNGIARFLPNRKLSEVTGRLNQLEAEFKSEQQKFADKYARLLEESLQEWCDHARRPQSGEGGLFLHIATAPRLRLGISSMQLINQTCYSLPSPQAPAR